MNPIVSTQIMDIVRACLDLQVCTIGTTYPETRHLTNVMNHDAISPHDLHFMTGHRTPKLTQIMQNPNCCLYYFNPANRHAVRLFGKLEIVDNKGTKQDFWRQEYTAFGYTGPNDGVFTLLRFCPDSYKFYIGDAMYTGKL